MKLLTIHPGASYSTADVYNGMIRALEKLDVELYRYDLDTRIYHAGSWLHWCWRHSEKDGRKKEKPTVGDVLYQACGDAVIKALHHEFEWVVLFSGMYFPNYFVKTLKRAGIKIAVILTESPYDDEKQGEMISMCDIAWTHERSSLAQLRLYNPNTFYLPHAYDADIHTLMAADEGKLEVGAHEVVFVGTGFQERIDTLKAVNWKGIDLGVYGSWVLVGSRSKLRKYIRSREIENTVTARLYRQAKIGLNLYRTSKGFGRFAPKIEHAESANLRAYELAACGLFHVSDYRKEVSELFGDLVPTFETPKELEDIVRAYLSDDGERERIAAALPGCVEGHTWDARAAQFMLELETYIQCRERPTILRRASNGTVSR